MFQSRSMKSKINEWFKELVEDLDASKYLQATRWNKYWKYYHENN